MCGRRWTARSVCSSPPRRARAVSLSPSSDPPQPRRARPRDTALTASEIRRPAVILIAGRRDTWTLMKPLFVRGDKRVNWRARGLRRPGRHALTRRRASPAQYRRAVPPHPPQVDSPPPPSPASSARYVSVASRRPEWTAARRARRSRWLGTWQVLNQGQRATSPMRCGCELSVPKMPAIDVST